MINLHLSTGTYLVVPIPEEAEDGYEIRGGYVTTERSRSPCLSFYGCAEAIELPYGNWQLIGLTKEIAESEDKSKALFVSEEYLFMKIDQIGYVIETGQYCDTAKEAFRATCRTNQIPENSVWLRKLTK